MTEITSFKAFNLGDENYFRLGIGKRVVKKYLFENKNNFRSQIPLYSANVFKPFGYLEKSNITKFENPYIIWGIDGNFDLAYIPAGEVFATTDHCGTIEILDAHINPQYLLYQLNLKKHEYGFDRGLRSNMENVRQVVVEFPVLEDGSLDLEGQKVLLANNTFVMKLQAQIKELTEKLASLSTSRVIPK